MARNAVAKRSMRQRLAEATRERAARTNPTNTAKYNSAQIRKARQQARLEGKRLTRADLEALGLRPKRDDKLDEWKLLTDSDRERIVARSKAHYERQLALGFPLETIYGPWTVLHHEAVWQELATHNTVAD